MVWVCMSVGVFGCVYVCGGVGVYECRCVWVCVCVWGGWVCMVWCGGWVCVGMYGVGVCMTARLALTRPLYGWRGCVDVDVGVWKSTCVDGCI